MAAFRILVLILVALIIGALAVWMVTGNARYRRMAMRLLKGLVWGSFFVLLLFAAARIADLLRH